MLKVATAFFKPFSLSKLKLEQVRNGKDQSQLLSGRGTIIPSASEAIQASRSRRCTVYVRLTPRLPEKCALCNPDADPKDFSIESFAQCEESIHDMLTSAALECGIIVFRLGSVLNTKLSNRPERMISDWICAAGQIWA
jgi:hypothetical protein